MAAVTVHLVSVLGPGRESRGEPGGVNSPGCAPAMPGSARELHVSGNTIREALLEVEGLVPDLRGKLLREDGSLNPSFFLVLKGGGACSASAFHFDSDLSADLPPGSVVWVLPVVTGG